MSAPTAKASKDAGDIVKRLATQPAEARRAITHLVELAEPIAAASPKAPFAIKVFTGTPAPARWVFPGLIEQGTCAALVAEPKACKTWFVYDLGIALATGQAFLGCAPAVRGPTLFVSPEGSDRSRHARIVGLCWGRGVEPADVLPSMFFLDERLDLAIADHAERLGATIDATGALLVVVDPLANAATGIDENSAGDVMRVLGPLRDVIAARPHCALILVHHTHKGAKDGSRSLSIRGSSAINGWQDTLITIRRADDDSAGPRRVDIAHRDAAAPEPVGFELHHGPSDIGPEIEWFRLSRCEVPSIGTTRNAKPRDEKSILDAVAEVLSDEPQAQATISRRVGKGNAKVGEALKELELVGRAFHEKRGWRSALVPTEPERPERQNSAQSSPNRSGVLPPLGGTQNGTMGTGTLETTPEERNQ